MMKKNLFSWMTIMLMAFVCAGFAACGGSDDDGNGGGGNSNGVTNTGSHEAVDLGLPSGTKWASMNVGANAPEECGNYYAWGDVVTRENYDHTTINYGYTESGGDYSKYNATDGKTVLEPMDDAATVNWGGSWRTPTREEMEELINLCTWEVTTQNDVIGCKVTGPNGKSIFMPAAGRYNKTSLGKKDRYLYYWTATLWIHSSGKTLNGAELKVNMEKNNPDIDDDHRDVGMPVRPITK